MGLIAAADDGLDQFTGSGLVLKLGACREFQLDQGFHRAGLVEFRGVHRVIVTERGLGMADMKPDSSAHDTGNRSSIRQR
jgi:hypothetical protein